MERVPSAYGQPASLCQILSLISGSAISALFFVLLIHLFESSYFLEIADSCCSFDLSIIEIWHIPSRKAQSLTSHVPSLLGKIWWLILNAKETTGFLDIKNSKVLLWYIGLIA